jgi:hypothetical protein
MKDILVPVSPGELLDKITILRIKSARIADPAKVANVRIELEALERHPGGRRGGAATGQRGALGDRGPDPRQGGRATVRRRLRHPRQERLHDQRRARRGQEAN